MISKGCQPELVEGRLFKKHTGSDRLNLTSFQPDV